MHRRIFKKGDPKNAQINEINIYLLVGDSNQNGAIEEPGDMDAKYLTINPNPRVKIYYKPDRSSTDNGEWQKYSIRITTDENVNRVPGYTYTNPLGPFGWGTDQAFTYRLWEASDKLSAILKMAKGGSSLITQAGTDNDWQKGEADASADSELYSAFFFYFFGRAIPRLREVDQYGIRHGNQRIKGVIIRLGTNDVVTGVWNNTSFVNAIPAFCSQIRAKTRPDLPIYWAQVRSDLGSEPGGTHPPANVTAARLALTNCTAGGSTEISGFNLLNYDSDTMQADGVHFDADSYESQGLSEANTLMAL